MIFELLIVIFATLLFSAFFSGLEIAYLSSNKLKLELDKKQNPLFSKIADLFARRSGFFISSILIGNNVALVIYSLKMTELSSYLTSGNSNILLDTLVSTIFIIFLSEYIPKSVVTSNPNFYYKYFSYPAAFFYWLFYPVAQLATLISRVSMWIFRINSGTANLSPIFNKVDLEHLAGELDINEESSPADAKDIKIFKNALDFSDVRVRDCMIQRVDIEAIEKDSSLEDAKKLFVETRFSRIPIYKDSIDNIIGYINIKQLFHTNSSIAQMLRRMTFVPETMSCQKLLTLFIKNEQSMAVVIDEFGVTAGIITIEDILEEIFGEIADEHDTNDLVEKVISDSEYILSARHEVKYLNEKYDLQIPENEEYDTLAGYILLQNDDVPQQGEQIKSSDFDIKILRMNSSRIELVKLVSLRRKGEENENISENN